MVDVRRFCNLRVPNIFQQLKSLLQKSEFTQHKTNAVISKILRNFSLFVDASKCFQTFKAPCSSVKAEGHLRSLLKKKNLSAVSSSRSVSRQRWGSRNGDVDCCFGPTPFTYPTVLKQHTGCPFWRRLEKLQALFTHKLTRTVFHTEYSSAFSSLRARLAFLTGTGLQTSPVPASNRSRPENAGPTCAINRRR